jgi:putative transposase
MTLFKDRYRAESARLKGWDYSCVGYYFVTICTRDRLCTLGNVIDEIMRLSPVGEIVAEEWQKTAALRDNVTLDEWVVMPNHIHGIICINDIGTVETHCNASLQSIASLTKAQYSNAFGPQKNNLSSIIRGFKGASTKRIHLDDHDFAWQSRFHDEIIRDENMLDRVREYIRNNPMKWELDLDNPVNTGRDAL